MRIGLDFDNTLAGYDRVFAQVAKYLKYLPPDFTDNKKELKRQILAHADFGEKQWMRLQGQVYGRFIGGAELLPGVQRFLTHCKNQKTEIFIISHKTQFGHYDEERIDLHVAAVRWMTCHGFFDPGCFNIKRENVFFLSTRENKVDQIKQLKLDLFIDDLPEVLEHENFPDTVKKILFSPNENAKSIAYQSFTCWDAITEEIFNPSDIIPEIDDIAKKLTGDMNATLAKGGIGGNNRLFKVTSTQGDFALKHYFQDFTHHRCQRENQALRLLWSCGEKHIPKPLNHRNDWHAAVFQWIEGNTIKQPSDSDVQAMIAFIKRLKMYSAQHSSQQNIQPAKEACLSLQQLLQQIDHRHEKLLLASCLYMELKSFLNDCIIPSFKSCQTQVKNSYLDLGLELNKELKQHQQILSPSDFGLHNVLKTEDQTLYFLDFEYFGWDDTVKLTADTLLHPGMNLSSDQKSKFKQSMIDLFLPIDPYFEQRLNLLYPLYALRWCLIILNPFLPEYQAHQKFTDNHKFQELQEQRMQKARILFNQTYTQTNK